MIGEEVIAVWDDGIDGAELVKVAELVRCRECKHREEYPCKVYHDDDWFCADGERIEE